MFKSSILNLFVRGLTILSRFILLFCLGKFFSTEDLGTYGIFYTTINLGLLTLGLDFYTFSNREIIYAKEGDKLTVLRNQLVFYLVTYSLFLLPLLLIFTYNIISFEYIIYFYIILVFDHFSQEFYRLFTVLSFPVFANWLLFLRNGLWVVALILVYVIYKLDTYSLSYIFLAWSIGSGLSVFLGFHKIFKLYGSNTLSKFKWSWIYLGLKTSSLYFISTIALIAIEHLNRYLIKYWCGLNKVGVFTFFSQISNIINVIIFTLFIMVVYPKLVEAFNNKDIDTFLRLKAELNKKVIIYSISTGLIISLLIFPMLNVIGKPEYYSDLPTFFLLVIATIFLNISLVNHYSLYALKKDVSILYATIICGLSSTILNLLLIRHLSILGAALALLLSYFILIITKSFFSKKAELNFIQKQLSEK